MAIVSNILHIIIAICLMIMVYTQLTFIKSDWCSWEIEKVLFTLEDIAEELKSVVQSAITMKLIIKIFVLIVKK